MIKYKWLLVITLLFLSSFRVNPCLAMPPMETMKQTVDEIFTILNDGDTADEDVWHQQRQSVAKIICGRFDMREMAKRSLAKYWKKRTPAEQDEFAKLYSDLIKNTYIERLRSFSDSKDGTRFDKELLRGNKGVVSSVVWQNNNEISVVYKMYNRDDMWYVYDVIIENVSLIRNYRSQFAQIIQKDGYQALVLRIKDKLAEPSKPMGIGEHAQLGD